MKQNILGYIAIGLIAILVSMISTSRIVKEERERARRKMLSIQMKDSSRENEPLKDRLSLSSPASGLRTGVLK